MNHDIEKSLAWALNQNYPSVAAQHAKTLAREVEFQRSKIDQYKADIEAEMGSETEPDGINKNRPEENEVGYKFYYCESEDSYLLGRRIGNFYYAHWVEGLGFVWDMSRYLPWGETVEAPTTLWKVHTYPSKPVQIGQAEWFAGFIKQRTCEAYRAALGRESSDES